MNKPENVDLKSLILKVIPQLFNSMLNMEVTYSEPASETAAGADGLAVTLDFSGDISGLLRLRPDAEFAGSMTAARSGAETDDEPAAEEMQNVMLEFATAAADQINAVMAEAGFAGDYSSAVSQGADTAPTDQAELENLEQLYFQHGDGQFLIVDMALNISKHAEETEISERDTGETLENRPEKQQELKANQDLDLDLVFDIPIELTVEIGRTKIPIQELLKLKPGSAVSLSKLENEPVDILANDTLIARGQVVVQDEKYGIRVTEITSRMDRI
ncbi:MAG: flagellar motor switch protein FliN, partial [Deltaproteobacteria bacterium]|nr:flagellar motor switch protein FliN [Deltaproteobacteria bacterium]